VKAGLDSRTAPLVLLEADLGADPADEQCFPKMISGLAGLLYRLGLIRDHKAKKLRGTALICSVEAIGLRVLGSGEMPTGRKSHGNVNCNKIYPTMDTGKQLSELKTVVFQLNKEQAIDLAKRLLSAAQASNTIEVTGFAHRLRNIISVTTPPTRKA